MSKCRELDWKLYNSITHNKRRVQASNTGKTPHKVPQKRVSSFFFNDTFYFISFHFFLASLTSVWHASCTWVRTLLDENHWRWVDLNKHGTRIVGDFFFGEMLSTSVNSPKFANCRQGTSREGSRCRPIVVCCVFVERKSKFERCWGQQTRETLYDYVFRLEFLIPHTRSGRVRSEIVHQKEEKNNSSSRTFLTWI